ncbi:MAG: FAD-dependent oxidoreductase [candidate division Zixibacteria bacterium]|nr:FAD-dependent oxidoreductase [candidate division Zixibacteria bacterium]
MESSDVVIVGGIACGPKAAAVLARRMPDARITLFQKEPYLSYASCGMPWLASGDLEGPDVLCATQYGVKRDASFFRDTKGVFALPESEVLSINRSAKTVTVRLANGEMIEHQYGKLVLATGALPASPPFPVPQDCPYVTSFHSLAEATQFRRHAEQGKAGRAVVIGAGFIGVELLGALGDLWGIDTTLVEAENRILPYALDPDMSAMVYRHVRAQGVTVHLGTRVDCVKTNATGSPVVSFGNNEIETDHVFLCLGVRPNTALAQACGLELGGSGGLVVNQHMQTSDPDIYAGGDCVESHNRITGHKFYLPMGSLANRHGRVIAEHIAGGSAVFNGAVGAFVVRVGELNVSAVGLTQDQAKKAGLASEAVWGTYTDRPVYFMEHADITCKMVYSPDNLRLLGLQAVGRGDVCRRTDVFSAFLYHSGTIRDLLDHEHAYAPPFSEALDPLFHLACQATAQVRGTVFLPPDLGSDSNPVVQWLDVREADEAAAETIPDGPDAETRPWILIPMGELRHRLAELDPARPVRILCARGPRSYQAAVILRHAGFTDVAIIGGGLHALKD